MKKFGVALAVITVLAVLVFFGRFRLLAHGVALIIGVPELQAPRDEGPNVRWHDDYYTIEAIDNRTFAIGEPRYWQENYNYLILGDKRAVLFDAGPGVRDIRPIVQALTHLPVTFIPSHFHYDHVGNEVTFEHVAVVDLPHLRERAPDGLLTLTFSEHLGVAERIDAPTLKVDEWLGPGSQIELGGRNLIVIYTPGHTEESISLLDAAAGYAFTGDFMVPGALGEFLPNGGMGDYLQGAETLLGRATKELRVFGAHRNIFNRQPHPGAPEVTIDDVSDLRDALVAIRAGELTASGFYPVNYRVNANIELWANPRWLQNWTPRHPEAAK